MGHVGAKGDPAKTAVQKSVHASVLQLKTCVVSETPGRVTVGHSLGRTQHTPMSGREGSVAALQPPTFGSAQLDPEGHSPVVMVHVFVLATQSPLDVEPAAESPASWRRQSFQ
jgi:hypothetical protein